MESNINALVHRIVHEHIKRHHICIDATCGNGHDTVFLAKHSNHVYGFDIQQAAIDSTTQKLQDNDCDNATLILDSHDQLTKYIDVPVDIVMYNLGYLPGSDKQIITTTASTIASIQQAISLLNECGIITITLYIGHAGGLAEAKAVESLIQSLDKHQYTVLKYDFINRHQSPYVICIQKIK